MSENLLQAQKISKSFGAKTLFQEAQFSLNTDEHVGVIGANGVGKSSLFKCMTGQLSLDEGQFIQKKGLRIGYLGQEEHEAPDRNVEDYIASSIIQPLWDVKKIGHGLGLNEEHYSKNYKELSGGYRMRVQLLILLGKQPDLLLLDEPTNYLDLESLLILEKFLIDYRGTFLLISHDREFLKRTTDHILEIENGEVTKFAGHIDDYFEQKQLLREQLEKTALSIDNKRQHILKFTTRFGAKASHAKQAQSKLKQLDKLSQIEISALPVAAKIIIPEPKRTGKQALSLKQTSYGYGEINVLKPFDLVLQRGDHACVVGVNGAGKSTLLKGLAQQLQPQSGQLTYGHEVEIGYYAQHVAENLNPASTIFEELLSVCDSATTELEVKNLAGSFLFSGDDIKKKVSILSGGEKARVALAQILLKKTPVLLLDEPTNHLDFHTVEALTQALQNYSGTLVIVSHDRSFVSRVSNKIIEVREGEVELYPGNYNEYVWSLQKGSWSDKNSDDKYSQSNSTKGKLPKKKTNHKAQQKEFAKKIRQLKAESRNLEKEMTEKKTALDKINTELLSCNGFEATTKAKELHDVQEELSQIEEQWLVLEEKINDLESDA